MPSPRPCASGVQGATIRSRLDQVLPCVRFMRRVHAAQRKHFVRQTREQKKTHRWSGRMNRCSPHLRLRSSVRRGFTNNNASARAP